MYLNIPSWRQKLTSATTSNESEKTDSVDGGASDGSVADTEDFSDISDDSDLFHVSVKKDKSWTTRQDLELEAIQRISEELRDHPMLPPDPSDAYRDFVCVNAGIEYPPVNCSYKGCYR